MESVWVVELHLEDDGKCREVFNDDYYIITGEYCLRLWDVSNLVIGFGG